MLAYICVSACRLLSGFTISFWNGEQQQQQQQAKAAAKAAATAGAKQQQQQWQQQQQQRQMQQRWRYRKGRTDTSCCSGSYLLLHWELQTSNQTCTLHAEM
jgi:hypothetical protein